METRRRFIKAISTSGLALLGSSQSSEAKERSPEEQPLQQTIPLSEGWEFRFDRDGDSSKWQPISVPHTWQSLGRAPDYVGVAWYRLSFFAPQHWASQHVRVEFEAVTHTAHVLLNGINIGEHVGKGYTAFFIDLSGHLQLGKENVLLVQVDNRPGDRMLPRNRSYDWADDGGIIRPVSLHITPKVFIERVEIDASPDLTNGTAAIRAVAIVRNTGRQSQKVSMEAVVRHEGISDELVALNAQAVVIEAGKNQVVELATTTLHNASLWHFDSPHLYRAYFRLKSPSGTHEVDESFGIRKFEIRGSAFYLNGEKISLIGVERMAGSHPELGFAETTEWIASNHREMKNLNCVYTRVHWPQDKRVLDFCDRNGILMQEEVPAWGRDTFLQTSSEIQEALEQNGLEQLREMIDRDRNHPCIVAWGLCNEVDGKNPNSRHFARRIGAEARRLDPSRLQTYASNSLAKNPGADMAGDFDFISSNEYYGSWAVGTPADVEAHMDRIRKAFPGKPIVVSEYGWCECQSKILPGDDNRVDIVNSHTDAFRKFPEIAGAIYFDYNDYRTLVGDKGRGAMRQRVHGVVDLYARPKPSFQALRLQASPIERATIRKTAEGKYEIEMQTRLQLPGYVLRGYRAVWIAYGYDDLPMDGQQISLPEVQPGTSYTHHVEFSMSGIRRVVVDIVRPTGYSTIRIEHLDQDARS